MLKKLRIPLACKVFLVCFGVAVVVSVAGSIILYRGASHSLRQEVRGRLQSVAATAALQVDPQLHERIRTSEDESSDAYRRVKAVLARIRDSNPGVRYVYTMRKTGEKDVWQFVVDAESDSENMSHVGDAYEVGEYPQMKKAFGGPIADQEPDADEWGTWLSGYAPIKDANGRAVAIIGMDLSMEQLQLEEASLRRAMLNNTLAAILLSILLGLLFTKTLLRPIQALNRAADRVREGDLAFQLGLNGRDELGDLARSFDSMIVALTEQTTRDFLTGLFNYMYFREALTIEVERAARCEQQVCLLILDLDRFKSVNDSLGHPVGNSILHQFGSVFKGNLRAADIPARYGGDEFVVILPNTDEESGLEVAERVRAAVEKHTFHSVTLDRLLSKDFVGDDTTALHITVSIGLACYPKHHKLRDGLVMAADIALCSAKNVARNSVRVYDSTSDERGRIDPQDLYEVLYDPNSSAIQSLAAAVDAKDRYTCGHSERVAGYATAIAGSLGLSPDARDSLQIAGLLHDLGKIGVPDSILNKSESLTKEEREAINRHPVVGGDILKRAPHLDQIIPGIMFHHERYDGAGYPQGLSGDSIPLMARVLAVADAFDAMTTDRPYRKAMSVEAAIVELRAHAGGQFDPDVVEAFIAGMADERSDRKAA